MRISELDHGVSQRQAFGAGHSLPKNAEALTRRLLKGELRMAPHPAWKGDLTDWEANPFKDNNWQFQHQTLRWINPLRWSALEGDEDAHKEWLRIVRSWCDANIPADRAKNLYAWRHMADGTRALAISLGAPLLKDEAQWYVEALEYHRDWLLDPKHIVGKNHGLHQHLGLLVVSAVLRDQKAMRVAVERMTKQFESTFDDEGTNDEGSSVYHQLNLTWWTDGWERVRLEGLDIPKKVEQKLTLASDVLAHLSLPNGELPQIGDASRQSTRARFSEATKYVGTRGLEGTPPIETSKVLTGGYIISRSGWGTPQRSFENQSHTLIRFGKELGAHSHLDRGSVHIYSYGKRWLVDSGFYSYQQKNSVNRYLKSRKAHNVAFLQGSSHDENAPVELTNLSESSEFHDYTLVDRGYQENLVQRRVIYFTDADFWIIADTAANQEDRVLTQHWHVEPGTQITSMDHGYRLRQGGEFFYMHWLGRRPTLLRQNAKDGELPGWVSTRWKNLERGTRIIARGGGGSRGDTQRSILLMAPYRPRPLGIVHSMVTLGGVISLTVTRGSELWRIRIDKENVLVRSEQS